MKCYKCGAEMVEDAIFCGICGTKLTEAPALPTEESAEDEAAEWDVAEEWDAAEEWETLDAEDSPSETDPEEPDSPARDPEYSDNIPKDQALEKISCPNCGKQLSAGTAFCNECGFPVSGTKPEQNKKKPDILIPAILGGAAVVGIIIFVCIYFL